MAALTQYVTYIFYHRPFPFFILLNILLLELENWIWLDLRFILFKNFLLFCKEWLSLRPKNDGVFKFDACLWVCIVVLLQIIV